MIVLTSGSDPSLDEACFVPFHFLSDSWPGLDFRYCCRKLDTSHQVTEPEVKQRPQCEDLGLCFLFGVAVGARGLRLLWRPCFCLPCDFVSPAYSSEPVFVLLALILTHVVVTWWWGGVFYRPPVEFQSLEGPVTSSISTGP